MNYEKMWNELKDFIKTEVKNPITSNVFLLYMNKIESQNSRRQYSTDKNPYEYKNAPKATDTDKESTLKSNT